MDYSIDTIHASDDDVKDFEEFITKQEQQGVGLKDGVFKVVLDPISLSCGTPHPTVLARTLDSMKTLQRQTVLKGDAENIYLYKKISCSGSEKSKFLAEAGKISAFSQQTCCTTTLESEGVDGLLNHYFTHVRNSANPHTRSKTSDISMEERKIQLLKEGEALRNAYSQGSLKGCRGKPCQKKCVCGDCDEETCFYEESNSCDEDEFKDSAMYYAAGVSIKNDSRDPIYITKTFTLSQLKNLLTVLKVSYDGVSCPYIYLGRKHSLFPIHNEDAALWSLSVLLFGAPKIWIVIAPQGLLLLMHHLSRSGMSLGNTSCYNFLGHKTAFPSTLWLKERGIPFKVVVQRPGEALILYPNAAHFGFNSGFNCAQAINFATISWIPEGINYPRCLCLPRMIHLDMSGLVAAFRPDLLDSYMKHQFIPNGNHKEMISVLAAAFMSSPVEPNQRTEVAKVKCPISACSKEYPIGKKQRLIHHVESMHRPLVSKLDLIGKINELFREIKRGKIID